MSTTTSHFLSATLYYTHLPTHQLNTLLLNGKSMRQLLDAMCILYDTYAIIYKYIRPHTHSVSYQNLAFFLVCT